MAAACVHVSSLLTYRHEHTTAPVCIIATLLSLLDKHPLVKWQLNTTHLAVACIQNLIVAIVEHEQLDSLHPAATGHLSPLVRRLLWALEPAEDR